MATAASLLDMADDEIEFRLRRDTGFASTSTPAGLSTIARAPFCTPEELDGFFRAPSDRQHAVDRERERPQIDSIEDQNKWKSVVSTIQECMKDMHESLLEERERRKSCEERLEQAAILSGGPGRNGSRGEARSEVTWGPVPNSEAAMTGHSFDLNWAHR